MLKEVVSEADYNRAMKKPGEMASLIERFQPLIAAMITASAQDFDTAVQSGNVDDMSPFAAMARSNSGL